MTGDEFRTGRESLGLTQAMLAAIMGYGSASRISEIESRATVPAPTARLMRAYLTGYRPYDWPTKCHVHRATAPRTAS